MFSTKDTFPAVLLFTTFVFCSPLMSAEFGEGVQYFPQLVVGGGATTSFAVHNPTDETLTVQIELYKSDGSVFAAEELEIDPRGSQTLEIGDAQDPLTVGWAMLTSDGKFESTELFKITLPGLDLPRVGMLPSSPSSVSKLFCFISSDGTNTGVAVANPSTTDTVRLTMNLYDRNGQLKKMTTLDLRPKEHMAKYVTDQELFPGLTEFEGIVEILATQPVIMATLRSDNNLLCAVAALVPHAEGQLSTGSVQSEHLADGVAVRSLNGLTDHVTLSAGSNLTIVPYGNKLTLSSTAVGSPGPPGPEGPQGPPGPPLGMTWTQSANSFNVVAGDNRTFVKGCPSGSSVISGGYQADSRLEVSGSWMTGEFWGVRVHNPESVPLTLIVYAICATLEQP